MEMGKLEGNRVFRVEEMKLGHSEFEMPVEVWHPGGSVQEAAEDTDLGLRAKSALEAHSGKRQHNELL